MTHRPLVLLALVTMTAGAYADQLRPPERPRPVAPRLPHQQRGIAFEPDPGRPMPPPPQPFRVPTEVVLHGKELLGAWQCKGVKLRGDGSSSPFVATITSKPELGAAWVQLALVEKAPAGTVNPSNHVEYRTFDATAKQWTRIQLTSTSAHASATTLGEQGGMWTWIGSVTSPTGTLQTRDFEKRDAKAYKLWGETMLGGVWQKAYELNCTR